MMGCIRRLSAGLLNHQQLNTSVKCHAGVHDLKPHEMLFIPLEQSYCKVNCMEKLNVAWLIKVQLQSESVNVFRHSAPCSLPALTKCSADLTHTGEIKQQSKQAVYFAVCDARTLFLQVQCQFVSLSPCLKT